MTPKADISYRGYVIRRTARIKGQPWEWRSAMDEYLTPFGSASSLEQSISAIDEVIDFLVDKERKIRGAA